MMNPGGVPDAVSESVSEEIRMKAPEIQDVIDDYFNLMGRGEDFATCYADDVRWTTFDGGTKVAGPTEVRDYLVGLHRNMPDTQTRPIAYAGETAYVEGDCADPRSTSADRIAFCIAYDVANGVITSARCYGAIGFLAPVGGADPAAGPQ
jgi:SnoaL-like domain